MAKGGYDLVTASGDASLRLIMGKRVQPINTALIAGWAPLIRVLRRGGRGLTSAVKSMARRIVGANLLMYNTRVFRRRRTLARVRQAQDLPDGKTNGGRVQAYDGRSISPTPLFVKAAAAAGDRTLSN